MKTPETVEAKPVEALVRQEQHQTTALTPAQMLSIAVQQGADTQKLKELMDLQDRYEAKQARLAYSNAIVQFQAMCPVVIRTGMNTRFGNQYPQWSTAHPQIKQALDTAQLGTTHSIRQDDKGVITVIGQVRHGPSGHVEEMDISAPPDRLASKDGKAVRNEVQSIKSTITYLEWLTMECLLGLKSRDRAKNEKIDPKVEAAIDHEDDDGNRAGDVPQPSQPKSAGLTNVSAEEKQAREQFVRAVRAKSGNEKMSKDTMQKVVAAVQERIGRESAADCLEFIERDDVRIDAQGNVTQIIDEQAVAAALDAAEAELQTPAAPERPPSGGAQTATTNAPISPEPPSIPADKRRYRCKKCKEPHLVKTANMRCMVTPKCHGELEEVQ